MIIIESRLKQYTAAARLVADVRYRLRWDHLWLYAAIDRARAYPRSTRASSR